MYLEAAEHRRVSSLSRTWSGGQREATGNVLSNPRLPRSPEQGPGKTVVDPSSSRVVGYGLGEYE